VINYAIARRASYMTITPRTSAAANFPLHRIFVGATAGGRTLLAVTNYDGYFLDIIPSAPGARAFALSSQGNRAWWSASHFPEGTREKDDLRQLLAEASRYAPLEQLAPFLRNAASRHERGQHPHRGRALGEARLAVEVAQEVWGR